MPWKSIFAACALATGALAPSGVSAATLIPHRAVYDLRLADPQTSLQESSGSISGRMVYEFTGAACEGYTVNFRFVLQSTDGEGQPTVTDLRTSNFEDGPGREFQFVSKTYTNTVLTDDVKGTAKRDDTGIKVDVVTPEAKSLSLAPSVLFPTAHLLHIIEAAERGETVIEQDVFDGSEGGSKLYRTTTIIGRERPAAATGPAAKIGTMRRWPVTVSYFDTSTTGDLTPDYAISFDLWENGVSSDLTMDYGDFALEGKLANYEPLPVPKCQE
jgi:hypothetical protein